MNDTLLQPRSTTIKQLIIGACVALATIVGIITGLLAVDDRYEKDHLHDAEFQVFIEQMERIHNEMKDELIQEYRTETALLRTNQVIILEEELNAIDFEIYNLEKNGKIVPFEKKQRREALNRILNIIRRVE